MANVNVAIRITSNYRGGPGFKKADRDVKKFRRNVGRAANSVRAFQFVLAGVTISTLTIWGKKLIDVAGELELLKIRLDAVEGSAKAGDRQFKSLFDRFKNVPFQLDAITDGFVRLRAAGVSTEDANRTINSLVDAVAVFGGSTAELQRATIGFQQVAGKGVLSMEELRQQIGESVPSAMALMSRAMGVTIGEFVELVKKGSITARDAFRLFNEEAEKQFGGFAASLEFTIVGAIQGLKSKVRFAIGNLFNVRTDLGARVTALIKTLTERIVDFINAIDQDEVNKFWKSFEGVALIIEGVVKALKFLFETLFQIIGIVGNVTGTTGGKVLVGGIIGSMLFGSTAGVFAAALIAINAELAKTKGELIDISKIADVGTAGGIERGKVLRNLFPFLFEKKRTNTVSLKDFFGEEIDRLFEGDFVGTAAHPRSPQQLFQDFLTKTLAARDRESPAVKGGLLGLSGAFGKLSDDMVKLADRANISAKNTLTPWLKTTDSFTLKLAKVSKGLQKLEADFDEAAGAKQREIDSLRAIGEEEEANQKAIELQEAKANKIKQVATLQRQHSEAAAAVANRANDLSNAFLDKQIVKLQAVQNAADLALGRASPFQIGLREIKQAADNQIISLEKLASAFADIALRSGDEGVISKATEAYRALAIVIKESKDVATSQGKDLSVTEKARVDNLKIEAKLIRSNTNEQIRQLKRRFDFGVKNLINDELSNQVMEARAELDDQILTLQQQINEEVALLNQTLNDPEAKATMQEKIDAWTRLKEAMEAARAKVSEAALLEQQLWTNLGQILENNVANALEGLITKTKTLKDAMLDLWRAAIREVGQYIVKLLFAKAIKTAMGFFGGGMISGGGGTTAFSGAFTDLLGSAKGNVFNGKIKTFADGGLVRGPTMFGLAGEAGTEAIMPLKRGSDGKLGVAGGGGDTFNISIQAIDTQSGVDFLMNNMETITSGLTHENSLNRGIRRGVN